MKNEEEILKMVDQVFVRISEHKDDPTKLLLDANSLSTLMYNLGDLWVMAKQDVNLAEAEYKDNVDDTYLLLLKDDDMTQGKAEVIAKKEHRDMRYSLLKATHREMVLSTLRRDMEKKISVLQSYASEVRARMTFRTQ
jgi:hypothetical protein